MGVMYNGSVPPTQMEATGLLKGLQDSVVGVCMLLLGAAGACAGPTLKTSVHSAAGRLVGAFVDLTQGVVRLGVRGDALLQLVAKCLEQCDAAVKMPLDNRTAIGRAITKVMRVLADASRELEEVATEAEQRLDAADEGAVGAGEAQKGNTAEGSVAPGESNGTDTSNTTTAEVSPDRDGGSIDDSVDDLGSCDALTAQQAAVVRSVHALLGAVITLLKAVVRALLAAGTSLESAQTSESVATMPPSQPAPGVQDWEGLLFHLHALARSAEDLAAGIYPAQDAEELASAAEAVMNGCELISEEAPVDPDSGAAQALHSAFQGVEVAAKRLMAGLQEAGHS